MNKKIQDLKNEYDNKMAKLFILTEGKLPEFIDYIYEIDILVCKMLKNIDKKD